MGFFHLVVSFFFLSSSLCNEAAAAVVHNNRCKPTEREALLQLKRTNFMGLYGSFASWVGADCCRDWAGVVCDNRTGHVIKLDAISGEVVRGLVSPQLGNLTYLEDLALTGYRIEGSWIARLTSLKYLRLEFMDLQGAPDLIDNLNMLPFISEIHIQTSSVSFPVSLQHVNFTRLSILTIVANTGNTRMPSWLFNITSLTHLSMMTSNVFGSIPPTIGNLYNLQMLVLNTNKLSGSIPDTLGGLHHLSSLDLSNNNLTGSIPSSLQNLTSLTMMGLSYNGLSGSMPEFIANFTNLEKLFLQESNLLGVLTGNYFTSLSRLSELDVSGNHLDIRVAPDWNPPFRLKTLGMGSCNLESSSLAWIQTQTGLRYLNLSNSGISGMLPTWLWDLSKIDTMDLSGNNLSGTIPSKALDMPFLDSLILANNRITGPLPQVRYGYADMSYLFLSNNSFIGRIPISYCEIKSLDVLDLSMNHLSGRIPSCLWKMDLRILNLASNKFDGSVDGIGNFTGTFSSFCDLQIVALNDNSFFGDFPSSLSMCSKLRVLDIGQNNFSGNLPAWIVTNLTMLSVLIVRSNKFYGELPQELHLLNKLQILDLSGNSFSGRIPHGLWNFSAMKDPSPFDSTRKSFTTATQFGLALSKSGTAPHNYIITLSYSAPIITKGQKRDYSPSVLALMAVIDLSSNELSGQIPRDVNDLLDLKSLNLSHNHLTGNIPDNIGALKNVESLDLSFNNLHGKIPESILRMASLSKLNMSYNNLSGKIPSGSQFFTFNSSSYIGNVGLCGTPLLKLCNGGGNSNEIPDKKTNEMHEEQDGTVFIIISVVLGFICGFWTFCGTLLFKRTWGYAYFKVIDNTLDKICAAIKKSHSGSKGRRNYT